MKATIWPLLVVLVMNLLGPGSLTGAAAAPTITGVSPSIVPNDLDISITITGTDFQGGAAVYLDAVPLPDVTWVSPTELTARVPWGFPAGSHALKVVNPDSQFVEFSPFLVEDGLSDWRTGGPYGGEVGELLVEPNNPSTLYAAVGNAGAFRSLDGGATWELIMTMGPMVSMALDTTQDPPVLYVIKNVDEVARSSDHGQTWQSIPPDYEHFGYWGSQVFTGPDGALYVGYRGGLAKTTDQGETWARLMVDATDSIYYTSLAFDPDHPLTVYAGTSEGKVYRSADGGWNWTDTGAAFNTSVTRLVVDPADGRLWAATASGWRGFPPGDGNLWTYTHPSTWEPVLIDPTAPEPYDAPVNKVTILGFDPSDPDTLLAGTFDGFHRSTDHGATWTPLTEQGGGALAIDPTDSNTVYLGYGSDGVYKTTDGANFSPSNTGLAGIVPSSLALDPRDPAHLYADSGTGLFESTDGGESWQGIPVEWFGNRGTIVDYVGDTRRLVTHSRGWLEYSDDNGQNWTQSLVLDPPWTLDEEGSLQSNNLVRSLFGETGRLVTPYSITPQSGSSSPAGGILFSADHGATWQAASFPTAERSAFYRVTAVPGDPAVLYAIEELSGSTGGRVWKSTDGGQSWAATALAGVDLFDLAVDPSNPQVVYAGHTVESSLILYVSEDGGATWLERELPGMGNMNLYAVPEMRTALYVTGWAGMRVSYDRGLTWQVPGSPFASASIGAMAFQRQADDRLVTYIATAGGFVTPAQAGLRAAALDLAAGGAQALVSGGVYRRTVNYEFIYLPAITR